MILLVVARARHGHSSIASDIEITIAVSYGLHLLRHLNCCKLHILYM